MELADVGRADGSRLRRGDRRPAGEDGRMSRRILLVAYFYPPSRDTGVLRPAAIAKWLRRLGHEVTVLTTSAYGESEADAADDVVRRPTRSAGAPACAAATGSRRCSTHPATAAARTR